MKSLKLLLALLEALPGSPTTVVHWFPVHGVPVECILWNQSQLEKNASCHLICWYKSIVNLLKSIGWYKWKNGETSFKIKLYGQDKCTSKPWAFASCCLKDTVESSYPSWKMKYLNMFPIEQHIPECCPYQLIINIKQCQPSPLWCSMESSPSIPELW